MRPKWRWKWWLWLYNLYTRIVNRWGYLWGNEDGRLPRCLECGACCTGGFCLCHHFHGTQRHREKIAQAISEAMRDPNHPVLKLPPRSRCEHCGSYVCSCMGGVDTTGCNCGHEGMGEGWHAKDCAWRGKKDT